MPLSAQALPTLWFPFYLVVLEEHLCHTVPQLVRSREPLHNHHPPILCLDQQFLVEQTVWAGGGLVSEERGRNSSSSGSQEFAAAQPSPSPPPPHQFTWQKMSKKKSMRISVCSRSVRCSPSAGQTLEEKEEEKADLGELHLQSSRWADAAPSAPSCAH